MDETFSLVEEGNTWLASEHYEEALAAYEQAIEADPDDVLAHYYKGLALCHLGRDKEALIAYEKAITLNPTCALFYRNKGSVLRHLKRYEEALAAYEHAIALDPEDAVASNDKGTVLHVDLQRYEEGCSSMKNRPQEGTFTSAYLLALHLFGHLFCPDDCFRVARHAHC